MEVMVPLKTYTFDNRGDLKLAEQFLHIKYVSKYLFVIIKITLVVMM